MTTRFWENLNRRVSKQRQLQLFLHKSKAIIFTGPEQSAERAHSTVTLSGAADTDGGITLMLMDQHQGRGEEPNVSEVHPAFFVGLKRLRLHVKFLAALSSFE